MIGSPVGLARFMHGLPEAAIHFRMIRRCSCCPPASQHEAKQAHSQKREGARFRNLENLDLRDARMKPGPSVHTAILHVEQRQMGGCRTGQVVHPRVQDRNEILSRCT